MMEQSIQDTYYANGICFGCGPTNEKGLRIKSFPTFDEPMADVVASFTPEPHHRAFEGMLNGGILGALIDCHSNWTAAWHLMRRDGLDAPPATVTGSFSVKLKAPTPSEQPLQVNAHVVESAGPKVTVDALIESGGDVTATGRGVFFAVGPEHPAFHRW